jgi:predicted GNAT superfamily acetyltransferase
LGITIRKVAESDLEAIVTIANSMVLEQRSSVCEAEQEGFLVSRFDIETYQRFYDEAEYFLVAEDEKKVVGFLLAYASESIQEGETVNKLLQKNLIDPFVLIKQIAVDAGHSGQGVASRLYKSLFELVPDKGVAAAIVTEPYNSRSVRFHQRHDFRHLCDILPPPDPDGEIRSRAIWYRCRGGREDTLPRTRLHIPDRDADASLLMDKMSAAISLYTHEDNLNWTKFGMLVTFMMALFAGFSYLLDHEASRINFSISLLLIAFGFFINALFLAKIRSGLMFMQSHKERVKLLETKLSGLNPNLTNIINLADNNKIAGRSMTASLLEWMPIVSMVIWALCSVILTYKEIAALL